MRSTDFEFEIGERVYTKQGDQVFSCHIVKRKHGWLGNKYFATWRCSMYDWGRYLYTETQAGWRPERKLWRYSKRS